MNRRGFLGRLAAALGAAAIARELPAQAEQMNVPNAAPAGVPLTSGLATQLPIYNGYSVVSAPPRVHASIDGRGTLTVMPSPTLTAGVYQGTVAIALPPERHAVQRAVPLTFTVMPTPKRKRGRRRHR